MISQEKVRIKIRKAEIVFSNLFYSEKRRIRSVHYDHGTLVKRWQELVSGPEFKKAAAQGIKDGFTSIGKDGIIPTVWYDYVLAYKWRRKAWAVI